MNANWQHSQNTTAQAYRLRHVVRVVCPAVLSMDTTVMGATNKADFIAHAYGGSSG